MPWWDIDRGHNIGGYRSAAGVATAVYLSEVGGRLAKVAYRRRSDGSATVDVAGLFIYTVFLVDLGWPSSGLAASLALSIMGLPIMARAADVVLRVVRAGCEASYALGAGRLQTVWRVILPTARPGLLRTDPRHRSHGRRNLTGAPYF